MRTNFGSLLRKARRQAGKTMSDLAVHLDVSVVFISDVERGNRHPLTPERIVSVCEFLEIDPEPLLIEGAKSRGAFELDAKQVSGKAREVGAALMRGWKDLNDEDLEKIASVVRRREGSE
jgi:transcriptional regulator with XRE-family HTH domain